MEREYRSLETELINFKNQHIETSANYAEDIAGKVFELNRYV